MLFKLSVISTFRHFRPETASALPVSFSYLVLYGFPRIHRPCDTAVDIDPRRFAFLWEFPSRSKYSCKQISSDRKYCLYHSLRENKMCGMLINIAFHLTGVFPPLFASSFIFFPYSG